VTIIIAVFVVGVCIAILLPTVLVVYAYVVPVEIKTDKKKKSPRKTE